MSNKAMKYDALIIGGGPAGATAALLLARAGWSVALIEKGTYPRRKVCGEFISATSLPLLHELGIAQFFTSHAGPEVRRVGLFAGDEVLAAAMPEARNAFGKWGRALGREHLDLALANLAVANGARIWEDTTAGALRRSNDGFVCDILKSRSPDRLESRLVIVANGSWERTFMPQCPRPHRTTDLLAFKANFTGCDLATDLMPLLVFPGGYGGLVNSDGGRVTLSCCIRRDALLRCRREFRASSAGEAVLRHLERSSQGLSQLAKRAQRQGSWLSSGPIWPGIRNCYAEGMFFAGNAAGEAHPIIAEGLSMAMQSGWLLAKQLVRAQNEIVTGRGLAAAGRAYAKDWNRSFARRIYFAAMFAEAATRPAAVTLLLPFIRRVPSVLTFGAQLGGKVSETVSAG
jgi:flavin-dependent dehydrogenase